MLDNSNSIENYSALISTTARFTKPAVLRHLVQTYTLWVAPLSLTTFTFWTLAPQTLLYLRLEWLTLLPLC